MLLAVQSPLWAQPQISKEYQIKAGCLFNFAQFVTWPPKAFSGAKEPFCIGILGDDPFDSFLDEMARGEMVNGRPLVIQRYHNVDEIKSCQILFISRSESGQVEKILDALKEKNILTVGDTEGFIKSGGIVRFFVEGNKIHFMINLETAKHFNLSISSKVLRLAEIVRPGKD
jgi:hypothetical protein